VKRIYAPWRAVYLNSEGSEQCLFCEMPGRGDDEKDRILYRGAHCFVVVNIYPYSSGHIMVVCNRHVERFGDLSDEERMEVMSLIARGEEAIHEEYQPGGINVGVNLGRSAGAGILGHLHIHLVPRWHGDTNFMTSVGETRVISEDLADTYRRLKPHFRE
jgi:ATP adenylyltransferase